MSESEKTPLAAALERFNRKERNLLFRALLGEERRLELAEKFCKDVFSELEITIDLKKAWWATDYHINWLAGALAVYTDEKKYSEMAQPNDPEDKRKLIEGNQEDIDLVIASGLDLILIEAKAYGSWNNKQLASKLARLNLLHAYNEELTNGVRIKFLLMSPGEERPKGIRVPWPKWAEKDQIDEEGSNIPWIELSLPKGIGSILEVNRWNSKTGKRDAKGEHWRIAKLNK